jgi:CheY-like chemotaxis protein
VLVVEDDETVLAMAVEALGSLGYRVSTATSARAAVEALEKDDGIDLVFSDVVMPGGWNGIELAHRVRGLRPGTRVLLTSGYVGDRASAPAHDFPLIDKPYELSHLAAKVREVLDAAPTPVTRPKARARRALSA